MLKEQQSAFHPADTREFTIIEPIEVRSIIEAFDYLPPEVRRSELTRVDERILDQQLLSFLLSDSSAQDNDTAWADRVKRRKSALTPYLNKVLICVFIKLPGIHYTIEIDPESERVVHLEWQTI